MSLIVADSSAGGLAVVSANVSVTNATITGTRTAAERGWGGFGVYASLLDISADDLTAPPDAGLPVLAISDSVVDDSEVAGIAIGDGADAVITDVTISGTSPGLVDEGDGLRIVGGAEAVVQGLQTTGNARASVLFDASTGSVLSSGGDEEMGLLAQDCVGDVIVDGTGFVAFDVCSGGAAVSSAIPELTYSNDVALEQ